MQFNLSGVENSTNGTIKKESISNLAFDVNADRIIQIKDCLFIFNRVNNGALIEIQLTNDEIFNCDRCLCEFTATSINNFYVELIFDNIYSEQTAIPIGELVFKSNPEQVDLSEIIRQHVISTYPMKSLCKESCKGLCSNCGVNLNQHACMC